MKNRMKYIIIALFGAALVTLSCQSEDLLVPGIQEQDGYVTVEFRTAVPDMDIVQTKAVDPDGGGVQQMQVFCFDANGIFITTSKAHLDADAPEAGSNASLSGKVSATVPEHAVTLQLVGNQNLTFFEEDRYRGMTEVEVMASLEASAGRMIYWARKTVAELRQCTTPETAVKLLRNQAKITLSVEDGVGFVQKGWIVVNSNAFGTVAPFNPDTETFEAPTIANPFVTLPENEAKLGDFLDVRTNEEEYIFESPNSDSEPLDFIVKGSQDGGADKYYRISIIDKDGDYLPILRNHHYTVNIAGSLYYGVDTFAEALETPPTNNVWVSVSDNIAQIQDSENKLSVDETAVIIGEEDFVLPDREYKIYYTLESLSGGTVSQAEVSWLDGNNVAGNAFDHTFDAATGRGIITMYLNDMGDLAKREGTLLVKYGRLSRKVKVITVKEQKFTPAWITTNVYGGSTGENVTMMFHIPEDYPSELFPMNVLVSVNDLDVRNASGMVLPVIVKGEEGYGDDNGIGYKYVLTVAEPGVQRVYLKTILGHDTGDQVSVTIEADNFETLTKTATFKADTDYRILLHNLRSYVGAMPADEVIYYYLVPQKVNARVEFTSNLGQVYRTNPGAGNFDDTFTDVLGSYWVDYVDPNVNFSSPSNVDEFLLYSANLDQNTDMPSGTTCYFDFYNIDASNWSSTAGRVMGFFRNTNGASGDVVTYHLKTNKPKADEVVRIASNPYGETSVTTGTKTSEAVMDYSVETCTGTGSYKSAVFELATFHPFHFSAQVKAGSEIFGDAVTGQTENPVSDVKLSYVPGQSVNIEFDITSFKSNIQGETDANQLSVDPFGTEFEVYIDAPMLELDESDPSIQSMLDSGKIRKEGSRVVYTVDASRDAERAYFPSLTALATDGAALDLFRNPVTVDQTGERKSIPFKTKKIVSAGEITISSDEDVVVYYRKNFKVQNTSITGTLKFRKDGSTVEAVPTGSFIPFETTSSFNRIGTVSVGDADGSFELRLRAEYEYSWETGSVKFQYIDENGKVYEKTYTSLSYMYNNLKTNNGEIILEMP